MHMIYVVANRKGGSGKTSISVALAACWAGSEGAAGSVLLADLDVQATASDHLGVRDSGEALARALEGRAQLEHAIRRTEWGIDLAPAGEAIGRLHQAARPDAVRRVLAPLARRYSKIIIDCAPALDAVTCSAWQAANRLIHPVDGPAALSALGRLHHAWADLRLPEVRRHVVLTRHNARRVLDRALRDEAAALYPGQIAATSIRDSTVVREAAAWQTPLPAYAPRYPATSDLRQLAREVLHG